MCTEASWGSQEKGQRLSVWFNMRVGELEGSIDWTSIFKLQPVLVCPYLKRVAVNLCFLSLEVKYILHSSIVACMQLSKFCLDLYVQSSNSLCLKKTKHWNFISAIDLRIWDWNTGLLCKWPWQVAFKKIPSQTTGRKGCKSALALYIVFYLGASKKELTLYTVYKSLMLIFFVCLFGLFFF